MWARSDRSPLWHGRKAVGALALLALTVPAAGRQEANHSRPLHRQHHAVAYDPRLERVVVHGGLSRDRAGVDAPALDDLWAWNGERWSLVARSSGLARVGHLLFADDEGLLAVGGEPTPITSRWDGRQWIALDEANPLARTLAAGAYDHRRKRFVVHGGRINVVKTNASDTWEFDGRRWTQVATDGPSARMGAAMAYDERRAVAVLFGGGNGGTFSGETWTWSGVRWARVAEGGPPPRFDAGMAYDTKRGEVVLFGGYGPGNQRFDDTWIWNGETWRRVMVAGPPARNQGGMAFDAIRGVTVLFGGCCAGPRGGALGDTWEWDGERWQRKE